MKLINSYTSLVLILFLVLPVQAAPMTVSTLSTPPDDVATLSLLKRAQEYVDFFSEFQSTHPHITEDTPPDVYLVMGSPFLEAYTAFADAWIESGSGKPIIISGGVGRGTPGLAKKTLDAFRDKLLPHEEEMLERAVKILNESPPNDLLTHLREAGISEAEIISIIFRIKGIPDFDPVGHQLLFLEGKSTVTRENYERIAELYEEGAFGDLENTHMQIVTAPFLTRRAFMTAMQVFQDKEGKLLLLDKKVQLSAKGSYRVNFSEVGEEELIELLEYLVGYPTGYKPDNQMLNRGLEMKGIEDEVERISLNKNIAPVFFDRVLYDHEEFNSGEVIRDLRNKLFLQLLKDSGESKTVFRTLRDSYLVKEMEIAFEGELSRDEIAWQLLEGGDFLITDFADSTIPFKKFLLALYESHDGSIYNFISREPGKITIVFSGALSYYFRFTKKGATSWEVSIKKEEYPILFFQPPTGVMEGLREFIGTLSDEDVISNGLYETLEEVSPEQQKKHLVSA